MPTSLGIDLGATHTKFVHLDDKGAILAQGSFVTDPTPGPEWTARIHRQLTTLIQTHAPTHIGLGAPGLAAPDARSIAWMRGRLEQIQNLNWTTFLQSPHPIPVLNDAHAALLGELGSMGDQPMSSPRAMGVPPMSSPRAMGVPPMSSPRAMGVPPMSSPRAMGVPPMSSPIQNAVLLTLGTGVGGVILCDGRLLRGHLGRAGHLGHITINSDAPPDIVRTPGSLEDAIGDHTVAARTVGRFTTTKDLVAAHLAGDPAATAVWLRSLRHLAAAITSIINAVDPELIILGGGIASAADALFTPLSNYLDEMEWRPTHRPVPILPATLGEFAGAIGAAHHAMESSTNAHE